MGIMPSSVAQISMVGEHAHHVVFFELENQGLGQHSLGPLEAYRL